MAIGDMDSERAKGKTKVWSERFNLKIHERDVKKWLETLMTDTTQNFCRILRNNIGENQSEKVSNLT